MPYTITYFGDPAIASQWVGFAKREAARLKQELLARNQPYVTLFDQELVPNLPLIGQRQFRPTDGVRVEIYSIYDNQRIVITAEGFGGVVYMESGLLDAGGIARFDERSWLPGILDYGDTLLNYGQQDPEALLGRAFLNEEVNLRGESMPPGESGTFNLPPEDKVSELTITDILGNSATFGSPDGPPIYLPPPWPYNQKRTQALNKPSLWAGNVLNDYIQAVYGSLRRDYFVEEIPGGRWFFKFTEYQDDIFLDYIHNFTTWMYVDIEGEYWMITIAYHLGYIRKMSFRGVGKVLKQLIEKNPPFNEEERRRQMFYLLTELYLEEEQAQIQFRRAATPVSGAPPGNEDFDDDGMEGMGVPPGFGWKANYRGNTAYITTLRESTVHNSIPNDYAYESRLWKLEVLDNGPEVAEPKERFRFAISLEEGPKPFFPRIFGGDNVWRPSLTTIDMNMMALNLDFDIVQPFDQDGDEAPLYCWWGTENQDENFYVLYYSADFTNVSGSEGFPLNAQFNRSCLGDPPPAVYVGTFIAKAWGNANQLSMVKFKIKKDGEEVKSYGTDQGGFQNRPGTAYKYTKIDRDAGGSPSNPRVVFTVDDVRTFCNQGYDNPVDYAQDNFRHPETGVAPDRWWVREVRGKAERHVHTFSVVTWTSRFAVCIPRDYAGGLYVAKVDAFDSNLTYTWGENDNQIIGYEVMGAWDGTVDNPGPISLSTLVDFVPSFCGWGTVKKFPHENVPVQPGANQGSNSIRVVINNMTVDFWGSNRDGSAYYRDIFYAYTETGFGTSGGSQEYPDIPDAGVGSELPPRRPGVNKPDREGWDDFLAVLTPVDPILVVPSDLHARVSAGNFYRDIWETPPTVGTRKKIIDDNYEVDTNRLFRTWVGHE